MSRKPYGCRFMVFGFVVETFQQTGYDWGAVVGEDTEAVTSKRLRKIGKFLDS